VFVTFAVLGVDGALWRDRHIRLHHHVVNLPGTGIDADSVTLIRLAPDKPWHSWHRLQPLYAPLLYMVGHASLVWIEDMAGLRAARAEARREFKGHGAIAVFLGGKAVHIALFLLLPWLALRPTLPALALGYFLASSLVALCFVILVVGTHVSDLADFPAPDAAGGVAHDWATHQVATSVDWSPTSAFAVRLSGGANAHVAHHLCPGHSHRHMEAVSRIIAQTAAEHDLPYRVTTFRGMVRGHWRHLVALSHPVAAA
jgi:linoleoyl-CoA desaturase